MFKTSNVNNDLNGRKLVQKDGRAVHGAHRFGCYRARGLHRLRIIATACFMVALFGACVQSETLSESPQGMYFAKKEYVPHPLPAFDETRDQMPAPIFDENPDYVQMYWKAWEIAFKNFYEPAPESGFVSQYIDAAFSNSIFLWDTCFLTMFCDYAHPLVPGIGSLDNFYIKQHENGEICRQIDRQTGKDYHKWVNRYGRDLYSRSHAGGPVTYVGRDVPKPPPNLSLDALNHPIFAWAELESVRVTGDKARLALVYPPLVKYYAALQKYIRQGNGLYMTDWASMDNSPRVPILRGGGTGVDISSEMALFARQLAEIATMLGKSEEAKAYKREAEELATRINEQMWDPERKFYYDLTVDGERGDDKTIAAYWTLLAGVASPEQADVLAGHLENPETFGRKHRVPSCSADLKEFDPEGGYWRGAVWSPTTTMVIRGLERYGKQDLANEIALEHLGYVAQVFEETGTFWENYPADVIAPPNRGKPDFVGWTGVVPILYLFEYGIGFRPDALNNRLNWTILSDERSGCERFRFNGHVATLIATPDKKEPAKVTITVDSDGPFHLHVVRHGKEYDFEVKKGKNTFETEASTVKSG